LVNEAALIAARENKAKVSQGDFEGAKDKVLMGAERKSMILSEKEKKITAYHEAGHAVIAKLVKHTDPVHKVTIIPRGRALGLTQSLPEEDRYTQSKSAALDQLAMLFGGRIAEALEFDEITSGAGNDIEVATGLARRMVCEWGMSEKLGPVSFGRKEEQVFLGRELSQPPEYSQQTAMDIDNEVRALINTQYDRAFNLLKTHHEALRRVAEALIVYETIDGAEVSLLIDGKAMTREPPKVRMPTREEVNRRYEAEAAEKAKQKSEADARTVLSPLAGGEA
jgi:cell division protease FtsH